MNNIQLQQSDCVKAQLHTKNVSQFLPGSQFLMLLTGNEYNGDCIEVWCAQSLQLIQTIPGTSLITSFDCDMADQQLLAVCESSGAIKIYEQSQSSKKFECISTRNYLSFAQSNSDSIISIKFHPSLQFFATCSSSGVLYFWDVRHKMPMQTYDLKCCFTIDKCSILFSPDGSMMAVGVQSACYIYDLSSGKLKCQFSGMSFLDNLQFHNSQVCLIGSCETDLFCYDILEQKLRYLGQRLESPVRLLDFTSNLQQYFVITGRMIYILDFNNCNAQTHNVSQQLLEYLYYNKSLSVKECWLARDSELIYYSISSSNGLSRLALELKKLDVVKKSDMVQIEAKFERDLNTENVKQEVVQSKQSARSQQLSGNIDQQKEKDKATSQSRVTQRGVKGNNSKVDIHHGVNPKMNVAQESKVDYSISRVSTAPLARQESESKENRQENSQDQPLEDGSSEALLTLLTGQQFTSNRQMLRQRMKSAQLLSKSKSMLILVQRLDSWLRREVVGDQICMLRSDISAMVDELSDAHSGFLSSVFQILNKQSTAITLDCAVIILPICCVLMKSKLIESKLQSSLLIQSIVHSFSELFIDARAQKLSRMGVDVVMEERYEKCRKFLKSLQKIHTLLKSVYEQQQQVDVGDEHQDGEELLQKVSRQILIDIQKIL
ncbi:hypothetical protein MIR68_002263 [Amoeboaphelidium protococcarum]|nr:hypothetical protein MIR68_002263 [Amoeboaphelidium protococcarum]